MQARKTLHAALPVAVLRSMQSAGRRLLARLELFELVGGTI